jgi:glycosyltransferase involved in cell wall biosynthesis
MLFGKPVVHFDIPTLRWIDGDVRVPPFDVSSFARQLRDLAGDEQARRRLGGTAYAAALRFEHEETSDRYLALVDQLLAPEPETGLADSEAGMRSG